MAQIDRVTVLLTVTSHTAARSRRAVLFRGHTHGMKRLLVADLCVVWPVRMAFCGNLDLLIMDAHTENAAENTLKTEKV